MTEAAAQYDQSYAIEATIDNLFVLGDLMIERLRATVPEFRTVASSSAIAGAGEITDLLPAVFVEPGPGTTPAASGDIYSGASVDQRWEVLIVVQHWKSDVPDYSASQIAGPLAWAVLQQLANWSPNESVFGALQFMGHAAPAVYPGFVAFQLSFQSGLLVDIDVAP